MEIYKHIISYNIGFSKKLYKSNIKNHINSIKKYRLISTYFYKEYKDELLKYKKIYYLLTKYSKLQDNYENIKTKYTYSLGSLIDTTILHKTDKKLVSNISPILYDILSSGVSINLVEGTYSCIYPGDTWYKTFYQDIKDCVKYIPSSVNFVEGIMGKNTNISCIIMACLNENIPLDLIRLIYIKSNINTHYNNFPPPYTWMGTYFLKFIKDNKLLNMQRYNRISAMVKCINKYKGISPPDTLYYF